MSYDIEVTWSGEKLDLQTSKKIHIIYKPASIVEVAWDVEEAEAGEQRSADLTTKELPDSTEAVIEIHRSAMKIVEVAPSSGTTLTVDELVDILVSTLNVPDGESVSVEVYRKATNSVANRVASRR